MQGAHPPEPPPIEGAEHRYAGAGGLRVHYAEAGEGAPVLLLHGWPQHHAMWREVIGMMRDRFRLIAPDLRGFGWTEAPGHGYDAETFARDQVALLDALGIEQVDVIGHDWGGWTAFLLAIGHPERVRRMVVCNAPHPWGRPSGRLLVRQLPKGWYALANAMPGLGPALHRNGWLPRNILTHGNVGSPFTPGEIDAYVDSFRAPDRALAASHLYRYYQRVFPQAVRGHWRASRLSAPTRLLFGERDRYLDPLLVEGGHERNAPEMTVELVADSGHFIVNEKAELVADRASSLFGD
jgi:pimeloyl-ACP methyl ester carboxylesterase